MARRHFALASLLALTPACASAPPPPPARAQTAPAAPVADAEQPKRPVPPGSLRREDVLSILSDGPPAFLSRVDVEPVRDRGGRFHGWRVVALRDELLAAGDVKPGDVLMTVNGQKIEDPFQFFDVFQSLVFAKELRLSLERDGAAKELSYPIDDDPSGKPIPRPEPRRKVAQPERQQPIGPPRTTVRIGGDDSE